ncbi:Predicted arabinose efflux permease, MFS family [Gracilibacillus ureilyticus]|uniref:Predicted arabinose efflux permease, MFS family n=1 Tax=Gracilibacillus ureilyticus TaxID=531814 RepID=A0A1H9RZB6_9BACI|nr:MFS transporter [Gracilibacillus ureilyticus]SER78101.1 Predicted arabinose efflux permease, MFS family [Gracilibacillus ureilyticus]
MSRQKIWTKSFISIGLVNLFVFITFYSLLTTLPLFVMDEWSVSEGQAGLVVTVMLLAAILVRPFSGNILLQYGKNNMLVISVIIFAITTVGYLFINNYSSLLILRFVHGVSFGILTTATSSIATDIVPKERRGEGLGYFTMSMNVAIVIGPFIGLTISQSFTYHILLVVLNIFTIVSVFMAFIARHSGTINEKADEKSTINWSIRNLFEQKAVSVSLIGLFVAFAYSSIISFISVYADGRGLSHVSSYFFLVFAIAMLLSRPYLGRQFDLHGPRIVIIPCMLLFSTGFIVLGFSSSVVTFLLASAIIGIGYGSLLPFLLSLVIERSSISRSGHANATFYTMYDTGIALGSFLLGIIVVYTGFANLFFSLAGFVVIILILFVLLLAKKK